MSGGREYILNPQTLSASVSPPSPFRYTQKIRVQLPFFGGPSLDPRVYRSERTLKFQIDHLVGKKLYGWKTAR